MKSKLPLASTIVRWKTDHPWVIYSTAENKITCAICTEADKKKLRVPNDGKSLNAREAFVKSGFSTFKNASKALSDHESSTLHRESTILLRVLNNKPVIQQLATAKGKEMLDNRLALLKNFHTLQIGMQGIPFRGRDTTKNRIFYKFSKHDPQTSFS